MQLAEGGSQGDLCAREPCFQNDFIPSLLMVLQDARVASGGFGGKGAGESPVKR